MLSEAGPVHDHSHSLGASGPSRYPSSQSSSSALWRIPRRVSPIQTTPPKPRLRRRSDKEALADWRGGRLVRRGPRPPRGVCLARARGRAECSPGAPPAPRFLRPVGVGSCLCDSLCRDQFLPMHLEGRRSGGGCRSSAAVRPDPVQGQTSFRHGSRKRPGRTDKVAYPVTRGLTQDRGFKMPVGEAPRELPPERAHQRPPMRETRLGSLSQSLVSGGRAPLR
jgi:hypothetical protein